MAQYCTVDDVSKELNGFTIDASSTPDTDTVTSWIEQESDLLNLETGRVWGTITVTDEILDYDGSGSILLNHAPIISVTSLYKETKGIDGETTEWEQLYEGRTRDKDFIVYKDEGDIVFHGTNTPKACKQCIKISYTYGYSTTNLVAKMIVAKRVALRLINTVINGQTSAEGGSVTVGAISISDPSTFSLQRVEKLKLDIQELVTKLGSFKVYRTNRVYD